MEDKIDELMDKVDRSITDARESLYDGKYSDAEEYVLEARLGLYNLYRFLNNNQSRLAKT